MVWKSSDVKIGVVWEGAFLAKHSLALVNREVVMELARRGNLDLSLLQRNDTSEPPSGRCATLSRMIGRKLDRVSATVRHAWPPVFSRPLEGSFVLWQPWEFGSLPKKWVEAIASMVDEVWVDTNFVKDEYVTSGVPEEKVKVIPLGVNPNLFNPNARPANLGTNKSFKFLFVGGTIPRKGIDILLTAYTSEFTPSDDVCLVIKDFGTNSFYKGQGCQREIDEMSRRSDVPSILYLTDDMEDEDLPGLYAACDCLVHPYRGEGFGLPIAEAMACGLPVIVTGYGACLDFCTDDTSYLIPATTVYLSEKKVGDLETVDFPYCAEPDVTAVRKLMRRVYENPGEAQSKGALASRHILNNFTWERTAGIVEERLFALSKSAKRVRSQSSREEGLRAYREGRWHDAIRLLQGEDDMDSLNALALSYNAVGDGVNARRTLCRALEVFPNHAVTHQNLAVLLAREGRFLEAARSACRAVELDPSHEEAYRVLKRAREMVRSLKPVPKRKKSKRHSGPTQAEINAVLTRMNSLLSGSGSIRPRLSLCMIVKNEEAFLDDCLKSVRGLVDELVVLDTGSTDRTTEIARSHGASVYFLPWSDNFSEARNKSLEYASGEWILHLDADERLDERSRETIRRALDAPDFDAYELTIHNYRSDDSGSDLLIHRACRLYRNNPAYRYCGRVHERITPSIEKAGGRIGRLDAVIHHYGYRPDVVDNREKYRRYINLLLAELEENPDNLHCLYNLGAAFSSAGDPENALVYLRRAADIVSPHEEYAPLVFAGIADALCSIGRPDEALSVLWDAVERGVYHPQLDFCRANALLLLGCYEEAITYFQSSIRNGRIGAWTGDAACFGYKAELGIAAAAFALGDYQKALESAQKVILEKPDEARAHEILGKVFVKAGRLDRAESHFARLARLRPSDSEAIMMLGDVLFNQGRYVEAKARYQSILDSCHDSAELQIRIGLCSRNLGEQEDAERHFRRAIDLNPRFVEARVELGKLLGLQRIAEALECFSAAVEIDPTYANAYFAAADLLYQAGRYSDAADVYQNALSLSPRNASAFLALGNCYYHMGAYQAADMAYRQALVIRPQYPEAENNLAMLEETIKNQRKVA